MVTVFTPTFNRAEKLKKLIRCLERQTDKNFEWIVVDDGSQDNTRSIIMDYKLSACFPVKYVYQDNQGKHMAYNKGISLASGNMFICLDSDDQLTIDAIEILNKSFDKNANRVGLVFPSKARGKHVDSVWKLIDGKKFDIIDLHEVYGITETCVVINTDEVKRHRFPCYDSLYGGKEKFCPEGLFYNKIAKKGQFEAINKEIYIYEYQESGLTKNVFSLWKKNFNGVSNELRSRFVLAAKYKLIQRIKTRTKSILNYNALCKECDQNIWRRTPSKIYSFVLYLPGLAFRKVRFRNA